MPASGAESVREYDGGVPVGAASAFGFGRSWFRLTSALRGAVVPACFPESVREEYVEYQLWDTLQAVCSYIRGIICTSALLEAAGVGSTEANALAAAVFWVVRDGFGMVGSLIFSCFVGTSFDSRVKQWRLFADVINDVGLCLDVLAPLFKANANALLAVTSIAATCKTMCGTTAGATKSVISAHLATRQNFGDVAAKEGAQETAVTLFGLGCGWLVLRSSGSLETSPLQLRLVFALLTAVHVYANWRGVRCLRLATINATRAHLLIDAFFFDKASISREAVARREAIFSLHHRERDITLGVPLSQLGADTKTLRSCAPERYELRAFARAGRTTVRVALRVDAAPVDELRALVHARLVDGTGAVVAAQREMTKGFDGFLRALEDQGWDVRRPLLDAGAFRYELGPAAPAAVSIRNVHSKNV
ncbi:vitamin B6 photo-protection and homoeostasis-domain-containing protein [Pelagophyceae sp. CCMP2097]|nr:vitamin B6 photo-protection and homoeostasis-domain-containing protein [Pelagophyceae sp. CCMP2097]